MFKIAMPYRNLIVLYPKRAYQKKINKDESASCLQSCMDNQSFCAFWAFWRCLKKGQFSLIQNSPQLCNDQSETGITQDTACQSWLDSTKINHFNSPFPSILSPFALPFLLQNITHILSPSSPVLTPGALLPKVNIPDNFRKQNMGGCECNAIKQRSEQLAHELQEQTAGGSGAASRQRSLGATQKEAQQKRRGKNALIVRSEAVEMQDNVEYSEEAAIGAADEGEIRKALRKHFIFSQLSEGEIGCFIKEMKPCMALRNNYVFKQGDKSGSYYIILEGVCQVEINGEKKRTLTYGDSFGDLGIIYNAPRSASVLALTDCELAEINRGIFLKVMEEINQQHEKENKKFLNVLSFFKELTEEQKNALASTCLTETYQQGQGIFNQGDDANSFYVIKEGTVLIKEKNHELREMDCFGENSILVEGGVRTNTLIAKTRCVIISMSRQNVKTSLGDSLKNVIKRNVMWKILSESQLAEALDAHRLKTAAETCQFLAFKKGQTVFKKGSDHKGCIYVLLNTDLKGATNTYQPNSIIELPQLLQSKNIKITEDMMASDDGILGKLLYQLEVAPSPVSVRVKSQQGGKEDRTALEKKMQICDFHVVRKLREGNFGKVYACWNVKTERIYAIKVLDRSYVQKSQIIQYIMNEEEILRTVPRFPFVVAFHKLIKDSNFIYFIMELIEGEDLFDVITKVVSFTAEHARQLVAQILLMMEHLHTNRIIYRDLKPENLMMNTDGFLTLVDMGTAKKLKIQRRFRTNTIIGTPHYMAPEIITGKGYSFHVDLWSLGVITYQLLCGKLPFGETSQDPFTIYEEIINSSVKYPRNCPKSSKAFIEKMLSRSPQHRYGSGYEQLKKHLFFDGLDWIHLMTRTLETFYKPAEQVKITPAEIERALAKEKNKAPGRFLTDKSGR